MSVKIRLRRMGKKKQPHYRIVVADSRSPRDGRFVENLGYYNPIPDPALLRVDLERVDYWLGEGAITSPTVGNLVTKARSGGDESVALVAPASGSDDTAASSAAAPEEGADSEPAAEASPGDDTDAAEAAAKAEPAAEAESAAEAEPEPAAGPEPAEPAAAPE
ncbi:MAG: 30S ribosomal protein S16 [Gemmatimonadetes bacterium]|nr:30S ribosomal protein S16 [Gemmatimonadota bacterium]MYB06580.1 30S ribosomal protein S16 [Gemmatimonadota bacterium]MYE14860.1 30S ribosomal protein S16 [Gemmatimonadota bacterium]MYG21718.1 30S ribosomal protein S16 [Gemmatimonadota bacterium]MYJ38601.1 30S ribosomal protein S16 [Gemmatimonadota bacterium]